MASIPGVGSEFSFCADFDDTVLQVLSPETPVFSEEVATAALAGAHILLIDDDMLNRFISVELLQNFGCSVESAENAVQALAALERGTFSLILMDIELPGMKGDELTRQLRRDPRWQHIPIIALTAHATTTIREQCLANGMNDYLAKPFELAQLQTMLLRWLVD